MVSGYIRQCNCNTIRLVFVIYFGKLYMGVTNKVG